MKSILLWSFVGVTALAILICALKYWLHKSTNLAVDCFNRGVDAMNERDYERAVACFSEAIDLDPNLAEAYYNRAYIYGETGEFDKAISDYTEAIRVYPAFAEAFSSRSFAYRQIGEYDEAMADCNEAIRLDPQAAGSYGNRGGVHGDIGEYEKAIADCTKAIHLDPKLANAYLIRGCAYGSQGEYDKAIADATEAIRLAPQLASAYGLRARAYRESGDKSKAMQDDLRASELGAQIPGIGRVTSNIVYSVPRFHEKADKELTRLTRLELDADKDSGNIADAKQTALSCSGVTGNARSYCCRLTIYDSAQTDVEMIRYGLDFESPDKFHITQWANDAVLGEVFDEWITIGADHYQNAGLWGKVPDLRNEKLNSALLSKHYLSFSRDPDSIPSGVYHTTDEKHVVLRYRDVSLDAAFFEGGRDIELDIWIDTETGFLAKAVVVQTVASDTGEAGQVRCVHVFSCYNQEFGIKPPPLNIESD